MGKVEKVQEGVAAHVVGVVSRHKNIAMKKGTGWLNIFTISDPFSGASIDFTIFDKNRLAC